MGDPQAKVKVNNIDATVQNGQYMVTVPLSEGNNPITAVATNSNNSISQASIQLTLDTTPPRVTIDSPADKSTTTDATANVTGMVNDIVVGTVNDQQVRVLVNGVPAAVSNRSFQLTNVALSLGVNTINAIATDRVGNQRTTSITVTRVAATQPRVTVVSGNNQSGPIKTPLGAPLVVKVLNGAGQPLTNTAVVFKIVEGDGTLTGGGQNNQGSVGLNTDSSSDKLQ